MQDLKTGHLIRASPRFQFYGQLIGSSLSIIVTTTAYSLYRRAYQIPGPEFPAPTAYVSNTSTYKNLSLISDRFP